jgi:diguanylate cyclase (GGDEF)-like protein
MASGSATVLLLIGWLYAAPELSFSYRVFGDSIVTLLAACCGYGAAWFGRSAHIVAERAHREQQAELARRDGLSGLYNYRHLNEVVVSELAEARDKGTPCAVAMIDLNDFKDVNDRFGHTAGDELIAAIGRAICAEVGDSGMVARYGGDEFALVLPGCDRPRAEAVAAAISARITETSLTAIPENRHIPVTASIGFAVYPDDGADIRAIFSAARRALHEAKAQRVAVRERTDERRAQDVFFAIGQAMGGSLEPNERLRDLVTAVGTSLDLDACAIWLVRENGNIGIRSYYASDDELPARFAGVQVAEPMTAKDAEQAALLSNRVVYIDDVRSAANGLPERFRTVLPAGAWMISAPLNAAREGILVMVARHARCKPPTTSVASAVARLATSALANSQLYDRTRRQGEQLSALAGIGGLLFGDGEFEERLGDVVRKIAAVTRYDMVTLDTIDPTRDRPFVRQFAGRSPDGTEIEGDLKDAWMSAHHAIPSEEVAAFMATMREPVVLRDPAREAPEAYRQVIIDGGVRSAVAVPITWQSELTGMFYFSSRQPDAFDEHDVALMQTIAAQLAPSLQVATLHVALESSYSKLKEAHRDAIERLAFAAEARDPYTGRHLQRIGALSEAIARRIGFDDDAVEAIGYAAIVHDLGKLRIPDSILNKPGELTPDDWAIMRRHPEHGAELLGTGFLYDVARTVALHHHERWDGSGYPFGLAGEDIPLEARIVAVADVYDALISARPYKPAWSRERALAELLQMRGRTLCPRSVDVFLSLWGEGVIARVEDETQDSSFEADFRERYAA